MERKMVILQYDDRTFGVRRYHEDGLIEESKVLVKEGKAYPIVDSLATWFESEDE